MEQRQNVNFRGTFSRYFQSLNKNHSIIQEFFGLGDIAMKFLSRLSNDDIFISYSRRDTNRLGEKYADSLYTELKKRGFSSFMDSLGAEPGATQPETLNHKIRNSKMLVIIGTERACQSPFVEEEIKEFLKFRRLPIVPIDFDETILKARWYPLIEGVAMEHESQEALNSSIPSPDVIARIEEAFQYTKRNDRLRRATIGTVGVLVALILASIAATIFAAQQLSTAKKANNEAYEATKLANTKIEEAKQETIRADEQASRANVEANRANTEVNRANEQSTLANSKTEEANKATKLAENAKLEARKATEEVKKKTEENSLLTTKNNDLVIQTNNLQKETTDLSTQSKMLQIRIAAQNQLVEDPLIAYKLAVEAYKLKPDSSNRKIILSALSKIDLFYKYQTKDYSIEDFKEPFILLSRAGEGDQGKDLIVFNMNSLEANPINIKADSAWIVPIGTTWKLLVMNWVGSGMDSVRTYQLWGSDGNVLSNSIKQGGLSQINFLNNNKVSFPLAEDSKILVWDLSTDSKQLINREKTGDFDTYFYDIYGALDTRFDGVSAGHYRNGLVLVSQDGKILSDSYTEADFDPSAFFSAAKWSPDGQYLAVNYFDRKRLGIWNPIKKSFIWLDPNRWIVESYSWSLDGHLLAFSGRTENNTDVTVEVVDASSPEQSRRIIYKGNVPIKSMVFLPGNEQLAISDKEGNISIIQISTGQVLRTGRQESVNKLFSTQTAFYSSSPNSFRIWSVTPAPAKYWLFQSIENRVYQAMGAADPLWNWLAVPFVENKTTGGIELRKIQTGEEKILNVPENNSMSLKFSDDGKWLVLETHKYLRIYNTISWEYHDFTLHQDDGQFISLKIIDSTIFAHALGKDWMSNTSNEYDYIIKLDGNQPTLTSRVHSKDKNEDEVDQEFLKKEIDGWDFGKLYKYQSAGIFSSPTAGWAYYVKCRDHPLGARDCDVQFVPTNLERLMNLYDSLLWNPTNDDLKKWIP